MTTITKKPVNPTAHLTPEDIEQIGIELDAIRQDILDDRGETRRGVHPQGRRRAAPPRARPRAPCCSAPRCRRRGSLGTVGLSVAKILENMEIGHNVMHGQWDWMRDPKIHSTTWEWDNASTADGWKHAHNEIHHTYTNIVGKDNDLGYGIMRVDEDQRWHPMYLAQPLWNFINACFFEYGIAAYDLELGRNLRIPKEKRSEQFKTEPDEDAEEDPQAGHQGLRRQPGARRSRSAAFLPTLAANFTANLVRNVWSHSVIMCGHFPEGVETFEKKSIPDNETRGEWYLRQMLGSANISGSKAMHLMTGNLSHQIEHHLFPDLPSNRYAEVAPEGAGALRQVRPELPQAPLPQQVYSAWHKVVRLSLPNGWLATTNVKNLPEQTKLLWAMTHQGPEGPPCRHRPAPAAGAEDDHRRRPGA